jgi:hypothetical protein
MSDPLERLRDTFAAAALTGLMQFRIDAATPGAYVKSTAAIAANAYDIADAMLRERGNHSEKPNSSPTLTDAEREAIEQMLDEVSGKARAESWVPDILRNLLERTK